MGTFIQTSGKFTARLDGQCAGGGLGLALALPKRKVIVLESDGSLLLSLFNLPTVAKMNPANLAVFVFDNQAYSGTKISEPTATAGKTDLAGMARSAGIENAITVRDVIAFKSKAAGAIAEVGLRFVVAKVAGAAVTARSKNQRRLMKIYHFVRYLERTEARRY